MKEAITLCIAWLRLDATTVWTAPSTYSPASLGDRAVAIKALHTNGAIFPYLFAVYSLPPVLSTITIQTDWQTKQPCSCHRQHAANTIPPLAELLQSQWQYSLCQRAGLILLTGAVEVEKTRPAAGVRAWRESIEKLCRNSSRRCMWDESRLMNLMNLRNYSVIVHPLPWDPYN